MAATKEDEKHEKIIRGLLKLPGNRKCINCGSLGPQYVCTSFSTFICTLCSGIHREFLHRIKSISMAKFTVSEVNDLQSGGNDRAREVFLREWNATRNHYPDNSNPDKIREFIKLVYVQRRFTGEKPANEAEQRPSYSSSSPRDVRDRPDRPVRPSAGQPRLNYAEMGVTFGNRSYVRQVPGQASGRRDHDSDTDEHEQQQKPPESPQTTASGSKRETVIRQLLQPPVEKRKGAQLQRNHSSGGFVSEAPARRMPQRSASLKDLMTGSDKEPKSPAKNNGEDEHKTVKAPPPVTITRSLSLIDLGPEEPKEETSTPGATTSVSSVPPVPPTVTSSNSTNFIDLMTEPLVEPTKQADPFTPTSSFLITTSSTTSVADPFGAQSSPKVPDPFATSDSPAAGVLSSDSSQHVGVLSSNVSQPVTTNMQVTGYGGSWNYVQTGTPTAPHPPYPAEYTFGIQQQPFVPQMSVFPPFHQPGLPFPGAAVQQMPLAQAHRTNPFDLTPLSNQLFTPPGYYTDYAGAPTWSDTTMFKPMVPPYPANNELNVQLPGMQMNPSPVTRGGNPFA